MLKTLDEVLPKYINADAAVGAFNLALFPDTKVLIEAAEEMNAPVILQISPVVAEFMGYDYWGMIAGEMARRSTAEVVLHLDHANMVEPIKYWETKRKCVLLKRIYWHWKSIAPSITH